MATVVDTLAALGCDRDTSRYQVEGERVVSVTEALRLAGLIDFSHVAPDVLERACQRGTLVHAITARLDLGLPVPEIPAEVAGYVDAYVRFRTETGFEPDLTEHVVVNAAYRYAGTLDRTGLIKGQPSIVDLKTSQWIAPWCGLQLAGYRHALPVSGAVIVRRYGLRLSENGRYSLHPFTAASDISDFLAAVRVAQFRIRHERGIR